MPGVPLDITPTSSGMRHHIRGTHYADTAVSSLEVLLLRYISLDQWALRAAANAFWRLYWPVSRGGIVRFEGTSQPLDPGSLYLISPHTAFDSECTRPFSKWYLHFHAGGLPHACGPGIAKLTPTARMRGLLRVICPKQDPSNPVHDVGIHSLEVLELTLLTLEQGIPHFTVATQGDSRVRECIHYVNTHLREKITLARLSRLAGVSPRSLARMFITELGFSPSQYVIELRLNRAMILLRHTTHSIDQIAEECGFPNRYYFTRVFSRYRRITPAVFREGLTPH